MSRKKSGKKTDSAKVPNSTLEAKATQSAAEQVSAAGRLHRVIGIFLLTVGVILTLVFRFVPFYGGEWVLIGAIPIAMILIGAFMLYRGKRIRGKAIAEFTARDQRPPVFYLRPFKSDVSTLGQVFSAIYLHKLFSGLSTEEEQLAEVVNPIGPLVAVGQPGEGLPRPGALRIYASEDEWKEVVNEQIAKACLVIVRAGGSQGLWWEVRRCVEVLNPEQLLILITMRKRRYLAFAQKARDALKISLPEYEKVKRFRKVSGLVSFDENWEHKFLPLKAPYWRSSAYKPLRPLFNYALKPIFQKFQIDWKPSPVSKGKVIAIQVSFLILFPFLFSYMAEVATRQMNAFPIEIFLLILCTLPFAIIFVSSLIYLIRRKSVDGCLLLTGSIAMLLGSIFMFGFVFAAVALGGSFLFAIGFYLLIKNRTKT